MPIRLSGMNSGLDTDAIVQELVAAYSKKTETYKKSQTKIEWKQEAWKSLNSKVYGLYTNISNLRFESAYNLKKTTVSDNTKATVSASSQAVTGTQKLNILETAQAGYLTGGKLGDNITESSTLEDLGYTGGDTKLTLNCNGETKEIAISKTTKISELMKSLQSAGVNASFDTNNKRIFISAKESGVKADFVLQGTDNDSKNALKKLGLDDAPLTKNVYNENGDVIGVQFTDEAKEYKEAYDALCDYAVRVGVVSQNDFETMSSEDLKQKLQTNLEDMLSNYNEIKDKSGNALTMGDNKKLSEYNEIFEKYPAIGNIIKGDGTEEDKKKAFDELIGKSVESAKVLYSDSSLSASAVKISGADAKIKLNGVEYTNSSNSFSINGLNINAQVVTGDGDANAISITTSSDVDGIYDTIKDFLTEYNTVINEITKLYNADSARDYQPLTDEEKDAMSETEVEKWEKKIKDSLLRRDSSLSEIMSTMTSAMSQSFEINGKKYSLSNFGIETLGYLNSPKNEQYAYHIDGDEDDTNTSGNEDKLRKAITEDSESVMKFMQELTKKLYDGIHNKMKSTELSSAYKVYNDKELDSQYKDYTDLITKWEQKVSDKEEYYYKKFSQMEVALSKIQNQTNSLAGLLGS